LNGSHGEIFRIFDHADLKINRIKPFFLAHARMC
jgi:hypothetical protein